MGQQMPGRALEEHATAGACTATSRSGDGTGGMYRHEEARGRGDGLRAPPVPLECIEAEGHGLVRAAAASTLCGRCRRSGRGEREGGGQQCAPQCTREVKDPPGSLSLL